MNIYLKLAIMSLVATSTSAFAYKDPSNATLPLYSLSVEYSQYNAEFDYGDEVELKGVAVGLSPNPHYSGIFGKLEFLNNKEFDLDYVELTTGAQMSLFKDPNFYALASLGIGYSWLSTDYFNNDATFFSLPVGFEVGMTPISQLSIYGAIGYKWLWDVTSNTTCRDGTNTNRTGYNACAYNGGVAYYNDHLGDNSGMTYKAGLRLNF